MNEPTTKPATNPMDDGELTPAQQRALAVLLRGGTQEQAGQAAGVTSRCVRNWLAEKAFADTLALERRALWEQTLCQVQQAAAQATQTLVDALSDAKATVRMRAAKLILDLQLKLQRHQASLASKDSRKPETRNQKLPLRNEAEVTVARTTTPGAGSLPHRALRLAMPQ